MLSRNDFVTKRELERVKVDVPERGDSVYVRKLLANEWASYEQGCVSDQEAGRPVLYKVRLVVVSACDEKGNRLFNDADVIVVSKMTEAAVINRIFEAAIALNQMSAAGIAEAEKNSDSAPSPVS